MPTTLLAYFSKEIEIPEIIRCKVQPRALEGPVKYREEGEAVVDVA